jgi:hypothetical protein
MCVPHVLTYSPSIHLTCISYVPTHLMCTPYVLTYNPSIHLMCVPHILAYSPLIHLMRISHVLTHLTCVPHILTYSPSIQLMCIPYARKYILLFTAYFCMHSNTSRCTWLNLPTNGLSHGAHGCDRTARGRGLMSRRTFRPREALTRCYGYRRMCS